MIGLLFTLAEIGKNTRSYYDKLTYNSINYKTQDKPGISWNKKTTKLVLNVMMYMRLLTQSRQDFDLQKRHIKIRYKTTPLRDSQRRFKYLQKIACLCMLF